MTPSQRAKAIAFQDLHLSGRVLVLPNAWDVASARIVEDAGAAAVATTSAAVSWSLGAADGDRLDRDAALGLVARIVAAVDAPVTADIETGYASQPDGVAETIEGVLEAGAVGVNLEDGLPGGHTPRPVEEQADRIAAARRAADAADVPLFINARIDTYLRAVGDAETRFQDTLDRAARYVEAGADGIFVPGPTDRATVSALAEAMTVPLNVMIGPGAPAIGELAETGVARISVGPALAQAAYAVVQRGARELLDAGTSTTLTDALDYGYLNALVDRNG